MSDITLRAMRADEWGAVADLICVSTNYWYDTQRGFRVFNAGPDSCRLFCEVYEGLDPGCCVVAEEAASGRLMGSCFYHPRPTHVSLGIMNVHPNFFGRKVASKLLKWITDYADREKRPTRLVSSAMNLDSFSLYSRAGFVPRAAFVDMMINIPAEGWKMGYDPISRRVRPARMEDAPIIESMEEHIAGIRRQKDYLYFVQNKLGVWNPLVCENAGGQIEGFLCSVIHPGSNMIGPGVMYTEEAARALIAAQLDHNRGRSPVFLIPLEYPNLVKTMYDWGAKNVEIHFAQVRGAAKAFSGIVMPTFMPETA
jgi:GNAT superfamily N-acetyltransferase